VEQLPLLAALPFVGPVLIPATLALAPPAGETARPPDPVPLAARPQPPAPGGPPDVTPPENNPTEHPEAQAGNAHAPPAPALPMPDQQPAKPVSDSPQPAPVDTASSTPKPGDITLPPPPPAASGLNPGASLQPPVPNSDRPSAPARAEGAPGTDLPNRPVMAGPVADTAPEPRPVAPSPTQPVPQPQSILPVSATDDSRPVGAVPTVSTPPIAVPQPGAASPRASSAAPPPVESFDEEVYRCQPGDTFDKISAAHYHTEGYAQALLMFNRDHPLASGAIRRDPPQLDPGQLVYIPPTRVLEARYRTLIPRLPAPAEAPRVDRSANASPQARGAAPPGSRNTPLGYQVYQVPPQGATMLDIARATLGRSERWAEVYNLNPSFRPEYRVPGGTLLRLPPDAQVTPAPAPLAKTFPG
jgi:hypothetical protein